MPFWSDKTEPLRKNRWYMTVGYTGITNFNFFLKKVDKPSYKTTDITHKFGNYNFYYPGRVEWNPITLTIVSTNDTIVGIKKLLSAVGFSGPTTDSNALKGASKKQFSETINGIDIYQLGASGNKDSFLEKWTLQNPFFTNIKYGDLSYESDEILDVEITIRYDSCNFEDGKNPEQ